MKSAKVSPLLALGLLAVACIALATPPYTSSMDYKSVRYHVDQCMIRGATLYIAGWYISGDDNGPGDIAIIYEGEKANLDIHVKRTLRSDVSDEFLLGKKETVGFSGVLDLPGVPDSFNANIMIIDKSDGKRRVINYSCNSLQGGL